MEPRLLLTYLYLESMRGKTRIVHIDDHLLFSQGLKTVIGEEDSFIWVGSAATMEEGIVKCTELYPDVVLLDYYLPDGMGLAAAKKLRDLMPNIKIVVLSMESNPYIMEVCKAAGVNAFLQKSIDKERLIDCINEVMNGKEIFEGFVSQELEQDFEGENSRLKILSRREKEVAVLMSQGMSTAQISSELFLSQHTINTHRKNILNKLGLTNTVQLAAFLGNIADPNKGQE